MSASGTRSVTRVSFARAGLVLSRWHPQPGFGTFLNVGIVGRGTLTVVPVSVGRRLDLELPLDVDRRLGYDHGWRVIRVIRVVRIVRRRVVPPRRPSPPSRAPPGADNDGAAPFVMAVGLAVVRATLSSTTTASATHVSAAARASAAAPSPAGFGARRCHRQDEERNDDHTRSPRKELHTDHLPGTTPADYLTVRFRAQNGPAR